jgi:hypothetical protein
MLVKTPAEASAALGTGCTAALTNFGHAFSNTF